ncbi:MAG: DinB family protein [Frankiaceae bacterium]
MPSSADPGPEQQTGAPDADGPARRFGWWDMFVHPDDDPRANGEGRFVGERATLLGYLRDQRLTLELKCSGLDPAGLASRSVPPSDMSLLGLLRHLAGSEHEWFRRRLAGQDVPPLHAGNADFEGAVADPEVVAEAWRAWRDEVAFAERFVAEAPDLELVGPDGDVLREVLVHLIEEYARHNGHADLLRERIDGRVGQ